MSEKDRNYNSLGARLTLENLTRASSTSLGRFMDRFKSEALLLMDGLDRLDRMPRDKTHILLIYGSAQGASQSPIALRRDPDWPQRDHELFYR